MADISLWGVDYTDVPGIELPKTGSGTAGFYDVSNDTVDAAHLANGYTAHASNGSLITGTADLYNWICAGAEFISEVYAPHEFALKDTSFNGWTPSTTAKTIKATTNVTTFVADFTQYEYMLKWLCEGSIVYDTGYTDVARTIRVSSVICQVLLRRPNSLANIASSNYAGNACITYRTSPLMEYWNDKGSHTYTWGASYGIYPAAAAATFSNSTATNPTVTVKTPTWSARCSGTYFSTTNAGKVNQTNSTFRMKGDLYRMKIGSPERHIEEELVNLFNNPLEV